MSLKAVNAVKVFSGEIKSTSRHGNKITGSCGFGQAMFESDLPVMIRGTTCSHLRGSPGDGTHLISQGCTGPDTVMLRSKWKFTGLVANAISSAFPFTLNLSSLTGVGTSAAASLAASAVFADWFAYGWVEINAGSSIQRRAIVGSTVPVAGAIAITLHRYFSALPALGVTVALYPGCDGQYLTCQAFDATGNPTGKFNNKPNFGGDPFSPVGNPSLVGQKDLGVNGGKK